MSDQFGRLGYLDGLRGIASLWVIAGHACLLTGFKIPIVASPNYAVDLFMVISGFIMYYQASVRSDREPFERASSWIFFWMRRFFRLSPVYYFTLLVAILLGAQYEGWRDTISAAIPETTTDASRYADHSWAHIVSHLTYTFGLFPTYAFRSVLPDWSIGLEMQFYLVFPFLFLALQRHLFLNPVGVVCLALFVIWTAPNFVAAFEMPTFLPVKINLFLAGMLIGAALLSERPRLCFAMSVALAIIPLDGHYSAKFTFMRMFCVTLVGVLALYHLVQLPSAVARCLDVVSTTLSSRVFFWLGELSYSAYLIHLLIMLPVASAVDTIGIGVGWIRFAVCFSVVGAITYLASWVVLRWIEGPGRALGSKLIRAIKLGQKRRTESGEMAKS